MAELIGLDYEIVHRPGKENAHADCLSRLPYTCVTSTPDYDPDRIVRLQRNDPDLIELILYLENDIPYSKQVTNEISEENSGKFFLDKHGILYRYADDRPPYDPQQQLVIPKSLIKEILYQNHDTYLSAHPGVKRTIRKIALNYYWPRMYVIIKDYVGTCEACAKRKRQYRRNKAPLQVIPVGLAWDKVGIDFCGPYKKTKSGNTHIIAFIDYRSKWVEARATPSTDSTVTAKALYELIITRHGCPNEIVTDRGTNFLSKMMKEIYHMMDIKKLNTSSYHPQTDGMTERLNASLLASLSYYTDKHQTNWDEHLDAILFGIRTTVSAATNTSPFFMLYGRHPRLPIDVSLIPPTKTSTDHSIYRATIVKNIAIAQDIARQNIVRQQESYKKYYDKNTEDPPFQVGD